MGYMTLYGCPRACMYPITVAENGNVADPVVKSSQGTCINYLSGQGCTANVLNVGGQALGEDNTAVCHTPSSFSCPGNDKEFEKNVDAGKCKEVQSAKVDNMCDDGPCDNDENSNACLLAKAKCEVDPETGSMCMPGNENDPCKDCVRTVTDSGNAVALAFTTLFAGLASTML